MRVHWLPPKPVGPVRLRPVLGGWEAVNPERCLVARAPSKRDLLVILGRLGATPLAGRCPTPRRVEARGTPFQIRVWRAARRIPPGQTLTYGELAQRLGIRSPRAVGGALGANPLSGIIPCHRVVARNGVGGFAWGIAAKQILLRKEACRG